SFKKTDVSNRDYLFTKLESLSDTNFNSNSREIPTFYVLVLLETHLPAHGYNMVRLNGGSMTNHRTTS
ncbi:unnamed protein product, partial [Hymenolepis diminuta]